MSRRPRQEEEAIFRSFLSDGRLATYSAWPTKPSVESCFCTAGHASLVSHEIIFVGDDQKFKKREINWTKEEQNRKYRVNGTEDVMCCRQKLRMCV